MNNAQSFVKSFSVASYIPMDGVDKELDYLISLSPSQATLYFERSIQKARNGSVLYQGVEREKYYVILSQDKKTYRMVKGAKLLDFTVRVTSSYDMNRVVKKCIPEEDIEASSCELDTLFRQEVESWRAKVEEYISDVKSVFELNLLARRSLWALFNLTKEEKYMFLKKAEESSDWRIKKKNILKANECSAMLVSLSTVLAKKSST